MDLTSPQSNSPPTCRGRPIPSTWRPSPSLFAVVVVVQLVAKLIEKALDLVAMGFVNKLAGAVFGLAKMWLILSFVILLVTSVTGSRSWIPDRSGESILLGPVEAVAPMLAPNLDVRDLQVPDLNGRPGLEMSLHPTLKTIHHLVVRDVVGPRSRNARVTLDLGLGADGRTVTRDPLPSQIA